MPDDLVAFQLISSDSRCDDCGRELYKGNLLRKEGEKGLCVDCADLGHLAFLGAGDACITRRARKYSPVTVVVLRWSRARKRYERQGILVSEDALARAETECLSDEDARARRQVYDAHRRASIDSEYVRRFAAELRNRYPSAPEGIDVRIAEHACEKHSGRIGRTAAAKDFDATAIDLAVQAHIRHDKTRYDQLLSQGTDRAFARASVRADIDAILQQWRGK